MAQPADDVLTRVEGTTGVIVLNRPSAINSLNRSMVETIGAVLSEWEHDDKVPQRRAHQSLLETDPSVTSVASVAYHWGFANLGRFAAAHTARYDEPPAATLRRQVSRRTQSNVRRTG